MPVWGWIAIAMLAGALVTTILLLAVPRRSEPGRLAPSEPEAGGGENVQPVARRKIYFSFSPFLPQGASITELKADGPFLVGRIRSGAAPIEPEQIRVTLYDEKHIKLDEVIASYPPLRPGEAAEITVLSYQLSRAASVSFDSR